MKKLTNKKGFTLVEMLIVVAIIAVLAAVAIPSATSALEKANAASDAANLRTAEALATVKAYEMAEESGDAAAIFFLDCSQARPELVEVDSWDAGEITEGDVTVSETMIEKSYGASKANQANLIRVDISEVGEITGIAWTPGALAD